MRPYGHPVGLGFQFRMPPLHTSAAVDDVYQRRAIHADHLRKKSPAIPPAGTIGKLGDTTYMGTAIIDILPMVR
jgi:hypothetical protein